MTVSSPTIDEQLTAARAELVRLKQQKVAELRQQLAEATKTHEQAQAETAKRVAAMKQAVASERAALKSARWDTRSVGQRTTTMTKTGLSAAPHCLPTSASRWSRRRRPTPRTRGGPERRGSGE